MENKSDAYKKADHIIEGVLARAILCIDSPLNTADKWRGRMMAAIAEARNLGATDDEIEEAIRSNLQVYNYNDKTFPVRNWMGTFVEDQDE